MTSQPSTFHAGRQGQSAGRVRLELDAADAEADGVWWPHSRDLVAELTDLFAALQPGFGPIRRVIYHPDEWSTVPRELAGRGGRVRLDGYRRRQPRTLDIAGVGTTLTLRIITPAAAARSAGRRLWDSERGVGLDIGAWLLARQAAARRGRRATRTP